MKTFELSSRRENNGRRDFKVILHEVYPDSCIDEAGGVGTQYNLNGICWIEKYCQENIDTIKGMSLRVEFLDEERTEIAGHGATGVVDGKPIFEDASMIGQFDNGYIDDVVLENGKTIRACIGTGTIDESCYYNFCQRLDEDLNAGNPPSGSVEIMRPENSDSIIYKYGYKEKGRIPMDFAYSGYALLGVLPSDPAAKMIELNNKEDLNTMNEEEIKKIVSQAVSELSDHTSELNEYEQNCEKKIAEANESVEAAVAEKDEALAAVEQIKEELDSAKEEIDKLNEEIDSLKKELNEAKAKELIGKLNMAIAEFTDDEKAYAKEEIDAFNADPVTSEVNSVVNKIWEGIGRNARKEMDEKKANANSNIVDIFGEVSSETNSAGEIDIFETI